MLLLASSSALADQLSSMYTELPPNYIRLLRIHKPDRNDDSQRDLITVTTDIAGEHDALSYSWNDEVPSISYRLCKAHACLQREKPDVALDCILCDYFVVSKFVDSWNSRGWGIRSLASRIGKIRQLINVSTLLSLPITPPNLHSILVSLLEQLFRCVEQRFSSAYPWNSSLPHSWR